MYFIMYHTKDIFRSHFICIHIHETDKDVFQLFQASSSVAKYLIEVARWIPKCISFVSPLYITKCCESICEKKSEIIWNAWKDVLFNALKVWKWGFVKRTKVWNQIKIWTLTSLLKYFTSKEDIDLEYIDLCDRRHSSFLTICFELAIS